MNKPQRRLLADDVNDRQKIVIGPILSSYFFERFMHYSYDYYSCLLYICIYIYIYMFFFFFFGGGGVLVEVTD